LGVFVDNHDNPRFLYNYPNNKVGLKQALVFSLTSRGIPFVYYGDEQYYAGGPDPACRESLWQDFNTSSDVYQMLKKVNAQRKKSAIWNSAYVERYVDDTFFAFSKGEFLVALTNSGSTQSRQVTYSPFANGIIVCNIFFPTTDC
jgi:alpha-amylase